jgi:WD40 repeat protein
MAFLSAVWSNEKRRWDWREVGVLKSYSRPAGMMFMNVAVSPDGRLVLTPSSATMLGLWDVVSGGEIAVLEGHRNDINSAAFSRDGTRVVTASRDKSARLWDATSGRGLAWLSGHAGPVNSAAFNADATRVVTSSDDETARVWDVASAQEMFAIKGNASPVTLAAFNWDGTRVLTVSRDQYARIWDVSTIPKGNILQVACAYLRMHDAPGPVALDGATEYPKTFDRPICVTDPPPPDPLGADAAAEK